MVGFHHTREGVRRHNGKRNAEQIHAPRIHPADLRRGVLGRHVGHREARGGRDPAAGPGRRPVRAGLTAALGVGADERRGRAPPPGRRPAPALLAWPLLGEKMSRWGVAGLITGLAGLVLVINPNGGQVPARLLGDLLFVGGAVCWAIYSLIGKAATTRFTPLRATLYATVSG